MELRRAVGRWVSSPSILQPPVAVAVEERRRRGKREGGARAAALGSPPRSYSRAVKPGVRPWVLRHDATPRTQLPFRGAASAVKMKPSEGANIHREVRAASPGSRTALYPYFEPNHHCPTLSFSPSFTAVARTPR
jgi:hypothetical protein